MKSFSQLLKDNNVVDPNGNFNTPYEMVDNMRDSGTDTSGMGLINKIKSKVSEKGINMKKGGSVGSASKRADGIAQRGKTKGKVC
jgi:hypothetical protein